MMSIIVCSDEQVKRLVLLYFFRDLAPYLPKSQLCAHCSLLACSVVDGDVCPRIQIFRQLFLYDGAPRGQEFGHKYRAKMFQSQWMAHEQNTQLVFFLYLR